MNLYLRIIFTIFFLVSSSALSQSEAGVEVTETYDFNYDELTEIEEVTKRFAKILNINLVLNNKIKSKKIQIISPNKLTKKEVKRVYLSSLETLGLTLVQNGQVSKVLPRGKTLEGYKEIRSGSLWAPPTDQVITQIIPLRYLQSSEVKKTLSKLLDTKGLVEYDPTNILIVSDTGYNIRKILEIISLLDISSSENKKVEMIPVLYREVEEVRRKLQEIFKNRTNSGGRNKGQNIFSDKRTNSLIVLGNRDFVRSIRKKMKYFDVPLNEKEGYYYFLPIQYYDAKKMASVLQATRLQGTKNRSSSNQAQVDLKIQPDERTNSLIIRSDLEAYKAISSTVKRLDKSRLQVLFEVNLIEVDEKNSYRFHTSEFGLGSPIGKDGIAITGWQGAQSAPLVLGGALGEGNQGVIDQTLGALSSDLSIGILNSNQVNIQGLGRVSPAALIKFIKDDGNSRILSSPSILSMNNEEVSFTAGEAIPFISYKADNRGTIRNEVIKENADIQVVLKSQISLSGKMNLQLKLDVNSIIGMSPEGVPKLSKKKIKQVVQIESGQTFFLAGSFTKSEYETRSKVPLLGDIPILGFFFRNVNRVLKDSQLLVFITPHMYSDLTELTDLYRKKIGGEESLLNPNNDRLMQ